MRLIIVLATIFDPVDSLLQFCMELRDAAPGWWLTFIRTRTVACTYIAWVGLHRLLQPSFSRHCDGSRWCLQVSYGWIGGM